MKKWAVSLLSILMIPCLLKAQRGEPIRVEAVRVQNGLIAGSLTADSSVMIFKGVPFAAPPVGALRWKEPQPLKNWKGVRHCDHFGPNAMQGKPVPFSVYTAEFLIPQDGAISEDCLYLNIWSAARTREERRPVIVFIHGGGYVAGSGSCPIYDGVAMAGKGVIFVTINYRLGLFGFYAHPALTRESAHHASGNYGILDQIAALQWVKRNIAAFGGDPDNVTIAGQSAGSMSVNILCASPLARGLFSKMIAESVAIVLPGSLGRLGGVMSLDTAEEKGLQFQRSLGARDLTALRALPADSLMKAFKGGSNAIVDGYVLPESVPAIFSKGKQAVLPLLTGFNADDALGPAAGNLADYKEYVQHQFGTDADRVLALYPAETDSAARRSAKDLSRDMGLGFEHYAWATMQSQRGQQKTFLYFFTRQVPEYGGTHQYGAFHTGEVMYAYHTLSFLRRPLVAEDHALSETMSSYWVNFARTGDPNAYGLPAWPAFTRDKADVMIFDVQPEAKRHPFADGLEYFYHRGMVEAFPSLDAR
jgi:para-nitrobenzyl esterase